MAVTNALAIYQLAALYDAAAHVAPRLPLDIDHAHEVMRDHVTCRAKSCPRKNAAQDVLVAAGRMVLDLSKPR